VKDEPSVDEGSTQLLPFEPMRWTVKESSLRRFRCCCSGRQEAEVKPFEVDPVHRRSSKLRDEESAFRCNRQIFPLETVQECKVRRRNDDGRQS